MKNSIAVTKEKFSLVGIIPVAQHKKIFTFPWHDCLMPIGEDFLLIENAVAECAIAGCSSIWIVCHNDAQFLIRERVGEAVWDPLSMEQSRFKNKPSMHKRQIPIHYVPVHPKDKGRRDSLGFSIAYGAWYVNELCERISKHTTPTMFFVVSPYGALYHNILKESKKFLKKKKRVIFAQNGHTFLEDEFAPVRFTMFLEDINLMMENIRTGKKKHYFEDGKLKRYSKEEAYPAKEYDLTTVFEGSTIKEEAKIIETYNRPDDYPNYWSMTNWEDYCAAFEWLHDLKKPYFMTYEEFNPMVCNEEKEEI